MGRCCEALGLHSIYPAMGKGVLRMGIRELRGAWDIKSSLIDLRRKYSVNREHFNV